MENGNRESVSLMAKPIELISIERSCFLSLRAAPPPSSLLQFYHRDKQCFEEMSMIHEVNRVLRVKPDYFPERSIVHA